MSRRVHTHTTNHRLLALAIVTTVAILLGCSAGQLGSNQTLNSINNGDIFNDVFGDITRPTTDGHHHTPPPAQSQTHAFFEIPNGWDLVHADEENVVYQLKHQTVPDASLVLTHDSLTATKDQDELRGLHRQIVGRLPSSFEQTEYREYRTNDRPHIYTALEGKRAQDGPEMHVAGYTVAIAHDSYTVFAAYRKGDDRLQGDVERIVSSLKPHTSAPKAADVEAPSQDEPATAEEPTTEAPEGAPPKEDAADTKEAAPQA